MSKQESKMIKDTQEKLEVRKKKYCWKLSGFSWRNDRTGVQTYKIYGTRSEITNEQNENLYLLRFIYKIGRFLTNCIEKALETGSCFDKLGMKLHWTGENLCFFLTLCLKMDFGMELIYAVPCFSFFLIRANKIYIYILKN